MPRNGRCHRGDIDKQSRLQVATIFGGQVTKMTPFLRSIVSGVLSLVAIVAFATIAGFYVLSTLTSSQPSIPSDVVTYIWNGLGALVG